MSAFLDEVPESAIHPLSTVWDLEVEMGRNRRRHRCWRWGFSLCFEANQEDFSYPALSPIGGGGYSAWRYS